MAATAPAIYLSMGLNESEYNLLVQLMGREPTLTELGMFAVMWSEHCGYKYSRPVLAYFKEYKKAMEGEGLENAGVVDMGDGLGVVMKVESHNHPSAVEPYQGAATGVGGIIRDIFTMGARPIASLNSLRFGPVEPGQASPEVVARNRYLFEHVVAGIGGYGNCVGVPTVAGEVSFHPRYSGNPLVNAMCVGIVKLDEVASASAGGVGNPVIYLGSATGKDGIHGATFASDTLGEDSDAKRPNVQIGDPFAEKLLIEATLEALRTGAVQAIQDMGAAGLTCSTVEMSSKGGVGMAVDLDLVPMREADMSAYELMLSESQERMLAVAHRGREQEVIDVFHKWGVHAVVIGHVTDDGLVTVTRHGKVEAQVTAKHLTDFCPTYTVEPAVPDYHEKAKRFDPSSLPATDHREALLALLASPNIADKTHVYRQYDQQVQTQTVLVPGQADAAVLAPRGTKKGLAVKIDGNALHTYFDPYAGGVGAVAEAARNVACTGAKPVAATDGLNFGNPQSPQVYWQFERAVRGIADACDALGTPVVSGNVSFYNESSLGEVLPTPLVGVVGILEDAADRVPGRAGPGLTVGVLSYPLAPVQQGLGASAFMATVHGVEDGLPTPADLAGEKALHGVLVDLAKARLAASAHDVSEGGIAVALAESLKQGTGLRADLGGLPVAGGLTDDALLFGEFPGHVVVLTSDPQGVARLVAGRTEWTVVGSTDDSGEVTVSRQSKVLLSVTEAELSGASARGLEDALTNPIEAADV
ncbi:MAG: phosphoribosylformylglycinamidine synthase subunit PurL [Fimbriimonadaceae bacterium]|nr:phosphoribosylformylglycinamidine synthase subunit PurL [Fimbriimonadaceae bacterium]